MSVLSPVTFIVAAPNADSFDHVVAHRCQSVLGQAGVRRHFHDLYAESFDPVLTGADPLHTDAEAWTRGVSSDQISDHDHEQVDPLIDRHRNELAEAKALAIIHPDWLGKPPAILVGWMDRVLAPVVLNDAAARPAEPQLERVLVMITGESSRPPTQDAPAADPLGSLWREQVGAALGTRNVEVLQFRGASVVEEDQRQRWLNGAQRGAAWICGADR